MLQNKVYKLTLLKKQAPFDAFTLKSDLQPIIIITFDFFLQFAVLHLET